MTRDKFCEELAAELNDGFAIIGEAEVFSAEYQGDGHVYVRMVGGEAYHVNVTTAR